ncbi:hypothetical protein L0F63_006967, partial [Massospora cicadina]
RDFELGRRDIRSGANSQSRTMQAATCTPELQLDNGEAAVGTQANQLILTVLDGLKAIGWEYDVRYALKYAVDRLLLELPEALEPGIYYPWVVQAFQGTCPEQVEAWHVSRASRIDLAIGRLDLCIDLLKLGIGQLGLDGLRPQLEKALWLQDTVHDLLVRGKPPIDIPLKGLLKWDFSQVAETLHDQILVGLSPRPLLQLLILKPEVTLNPHTICKILDFSTSEGWDELKLDYVKACLIAAASLPVSAHLISGLVALIDHRALFHGVTADVCLAATHGEVEYLKGVDALAGAYPLYQFLSQQVEGWRILEKRKLELPPLRKCLRQFLMATPTQHRHWLQKVVRSTCPSLGNLEAALAFWGDLQRLASLGHFGTLSPAQLLDALLEGLISCDAYELVAQLARRGEEVPVSPAALENMALAASQERFANSLTLDSRTILECSEPLAIAPEAPALLAWRSFMSGAYQLTQACAADRVTPLPLPAEIHFDPQAQLHRALLHPRSHLYKDLDLCYDLARRLGASVHPIGGLAVSAAVQRGDFSSAYVTCLSLLQADFEAALEVCLGLAQNDAFRDLDKRLRLVAIALTKCPPSQFQQWLVCYRELEVEALPPEARALFRTEAPLGPKAFQEVFKDLPATERLALKSHPMYASEVSSIGNDFYDGTLLPSPIEQGFRLLGMLADGRADALLLTEVVAFGKWLEVLKASDAHRYQYHLLHLPHGTRERLLDVETAHGSPEEALQAAYIHCLAALQHLVCRRLASEHVPNLLHIQPAQVLMALETHQLAPSATQDAALQRQLQLADKAYLSANEMIHRHRLSLLLDKLGVDPPDFLARDLASKAALLERKAATVEVAELGWVLEVGSLVHVDLEAIRLANLKHFFSNPGVDSEAYWARVVQPHLAAMHPQRLHSCLLGAYPLVDGTNVGHLRRLFKTMVDTRRKLSPPHPVDQLQLRLGLLEGWAAWLEPEGLVDFKAIVKHLLGGDWGQLRRLMAPLLRDVDRLAAQVPQLAALAAMFEGEGGGPRPSEDALASRFYRWGFESKVEGLKANFGLVLVDDVAADAVAAFPKLTAEDLGILLERLCGPEEAGCVPLATSQFLLKTGLALPTGNEAGSKLAPLQARLQRLQRLSDLTDPVTGEDLGFSTLQLIDGAQLLDPDLGDPDSVRGLYLQLLRERLSPWLLEGVAQLLPHPPTLAEALLSLLRSRSVGAADVVAGFGAQLNLYLHGGPLSDWAEALRLDVREMLLDEILPDTRLDVSLRQELLVALYNVYGMDTEEGIRVLLEWRCNLLLGLETPISLDEMLHQPSDRLLPVLVVISRYRQFLGASRTIALEVSVAWMRVLIELAANPSTSPVQLHHLWLYLSHALEARAIRDHSQAWLHTLRVFHPLAYYRVGLSLPDAGAFDSIAQEFLAASHYDLGIHDDPVIFALLLARGKAASLVRSCPNLFKAEVLPRLVGDLGYPALQQSVLRSLLLSADPHVQAHAEFLAAQLRYRYAQRFHPQPDPQLVKCRVNLKYPQILPTPVPLYDATPPTLDELAELLASPPLPEFPQEAAPYIAQILASHLPHHP